MPTIPVIFLPLTLDTYVSIGKVIVMAQPDATVLPAALKAWRKERGLSQEGLADKADISAGMVAQVETGRRQLGIANLVAVANALEVSPHAIALITVDLTAITGDAA